MLSACAGVPRPRIAVAPPSSPPARSLGPLSPLLAVDVALGSHYVGADVPGEELVRVRVRALASDAPRPPINLALVVDTSGSMQGDAIADARAACIAALGELSPGDRVSVVAFHSRAVVVIPSTEFHPAMLNDLRARINAMQARGTTDLAAGLTLGLQELHNGAFRGAVSRMVLLGDGLPNDPRHIDDIAQRARALGVVVTTLGLGPDYDPALLGLIAERSGGRFVHLDRSSEVAAVFRDEVLRVHQVVARNVVLRLLPGPGVSVREVLGRGYSANGASADVPLLDVAEGEPRDVFVRLGVPARHAGSVIELLDGALEYLPTDPEDTRPRSEGFFVGVAAHADAEAVAQSRNEEVLDEAARVQISAGMVQAIREAQQGSVDQAQTTLARAEAQADATQPPRGAAPPSDATRRRRSSARRLQLELGNLSHRASAESVHLDDDSARRSTVGVAAAAPELPTEINRASNAQHTPTAAPTTAPDAPPVSPSPPPVPSSTPPATSVSEPRPVAPPTSAPARSAVFGTPQSEALSDLH